MVKIYGMPGKTSAIINIPFNRGKGNLNVEFTRGCIDRKNYRPATYRCDNAIEQAIIESSQDFGKNILLLQTIGDAETATAPVKKDTEPQETRQYPDVTSYEEAVAILKSIPGVKAVQLRNPELVKKLAATKGIEFPNYNFD